MTRKPQRLGTAGLPDGRDRALGAAALHFDLRGSRLPRQEGGQLADLDDVLTVTRQAFSAEVAGLPCRVRQQDLLPLVVYAVDPAATTVTADHLARLITGIQQVRRPDRTVRVNELGKYSSPLRCRQVGWTARRPCNRKWPRCGRRWTRCSPDRVPGGRPSTCGRTSSGGASPAVLLRGSAQPRVTGPDDYSPQVLELLGRHQDEVTPDALFSLVELVWQVRQNHALHPGVTRDRLADAAIRRDWSDKPRGQGHHGGTFRALPDCGCKDRQGRGTCSGTLLS